MTQAGKKPCPICAQGEMEELNRIVHDDQSVTTYWRCPTCSHVQVTGTPAAADRDPRPKRNSRR